MKTMKVVALISGGKDSCYNMMQCIATGHQIVALANLKPSGGTEIDSYMYQCVGHEAIELIAEAMQLPLFCQEIIGSSTNLDMNYTVTEQDEVEDLFDLLQRVKKELSVEAVAVGAILSDYQRTRVENVCSRLNLVALSYLWRRDQNELLQEMIKAEVDAIIIKVAALGLDPTRHLGRSLRLVVPHLQAMHDKYGLNVCGEGGEYETLVLDCPLFSSRIIIEESEVVIHSNDAIAPVGYLKLNKLKLETKLPHLNLDDRLSNVPLRNSNEFITDQSEENILIPPDDIQSQDEKIFTYNIEDLPFDKLTCQPSNDGWLCIGVLCGNTENCEECLKEALEKLKSSLTDNGHKLEDIVSITMYISDMSKFVELNKLYVDVLKHMNPPTRACVQVPLPKNCPIVLEVLSWNQLTTQKQGDVLFERHTMHVQSISHWAPANIGPYSQAIRIGDTIHVAGQIGLVPGSMQLVQGGAETQSQVAARNLGRIINAMDPNSNLRNVVQAICYVTDIKLIDSVRKLWEIKTNNAIVNYVVVTGLPKNALIEWHAWAHRHNSGFEYEETGKCIDNLSISIYRRYFYDSNISAVVSHIDCSQDNNATISIEHYVEMFKYIIHKLQLGLENDATSICNLKIFYNVKKDILINDLIYVVDELKKTVLLVYTVVPVVDLYNEHTLLSVSGMHIP
ncbi:hypothetical protein FQA39_LY04178 [Lamprigera yunnana]|nr:hypothetical protein FQA39_LY04178 [Lamprigera yunnana]